MRLKTKIEQKVVNWRNKLKIIIMRTLLILLLFGISTFVYSAPKKPVCNFNPDSVFVSSREYQELKCQIIQIVNETTKATERITAIKDENDKRATVLMWAIGIMATLLVFITGGSMWKNYLDMKNMIVETKAIARTETDKELKEYKDKAEDIMSDLVQKKDDITKIAQDVEGIAASIQSINYGGK